MERERGGRDLIVGMHLLIYWFVLFLKHDGRTDSLNHQQNFVEQLEPITGTVSHTHT